MHLPNCDSNDVLEILQRQLTDMHKQGHNTAPVSIQELATVHYEVEPPLTEYDDEPIRSNIHLLDPSVPYRYTVTLPTQSPPAYGLILLSSRQVPWTVSIPDNFISTGIPNPLRDSILSHTPTITRATTIQARPARDDCTIYCLAFQNLTATHCYKLFRDATIATLHHHLNTHEHRGQNTNKNKIRLALPVSTCTTPSPRLHTTGKSLATPPRTPHDGNIHTHCYRLYPPSPPSPILHHRPALTCCNESILDLLNPPTEAHIRQAGGHGVEPLVAYNPPHPIRCHPSNPLPR